MRLGFTFTHMMIFSLAISIAVAFAAPPPVTPKGFHLNEKDGITEAELFKDDRKTHVFTEVIVKNDGEADVVLKLAWEDSQGQSQGWESDVVFANSEKKIDSTVLPKGIYGAWVELQNTTAPDDRTRGTVHFKK